MYLSKRDAQGIKWSKLGKNFTYLHRIGCVAPAMLAWLVPIKRLLFFETLFDYFMPFGLGMLSFMFVFMVNILFDLYFS